MEKYLLKTTYLIVFLAIMLILNSCSTSIAPSLAAANNIGYLPRPTLADSNKSKIYISADFANYKDDNNVISINLGSVNISNGYTFNKFNFGYGVFGFAGLANYKNPKPDRLLPIENFSKSIIGGGIRSTIGLQPSVNDKSFNFRILNWENAISFENGQFYKLRSYLYNNTPHTSGDDYTEVSQSRTLFTTGLSTEGINDSKWGNKTAKFGYRVFIGYSPFLKNTFKNIEGNQNYNKNKVATIFDIFFQVNKLYSILEYNQQSYSGGRLTFGYSF